MAYDENTIRREARRRFGEWNQGDPRGILAGYPIHLRAEGATADLRRAAGSVMGAYAAKRRAVLEAQAAAETSLLGHQRKMEAAEAEAQAKGKEERLTTQERGKQERETAAEPYQRKPFEAGGYIYTWNAATGNYDKSPARFRPPSFFGGLGPEQRITSLDRLTASQNAQAKFTQKVNALLGAATETRWIPVVDPRTKKQAIDPATNTLMWDYKEVSTGKGMALATEDEKSFFVTAQKLVGAAAANPGNAAEALNRLNEAAASVGGGDVGAARGVLSPITARILEAAAGDINTAAVAGGAGTSAAAQSAFDPTQMTMEELERIAGER